MRVGLYPGTFDPITFGHIDIIGRAASLVDRLVLGVAINKDKNPLFPVKERVQMISDQVDIIAENLKVDIVVHPFEKLLIDFARDVKASLIFRGLRAVSDFEYEFQMVSMNRALNDSIETVFLMADANHQAISSKLVKEIARMGGEIGNFVPKNVVRMLEKKMNC